MTAARRITRAGRDFLVGDATTLAGLSGGSDGVDGVGLLIEVDVATAAPFAVARALATLDHLSDGRAGALLVGGSDARAEEFRAVVEAFWSSWAPGAVLADDATGTYVDPERIRPVEHAGEYYRVHGPATLPAGPQPRPVLLREHTGL